MSRGQRLAAFQSPGASPNRKNKVESAETTVQRRAGALISEFRGCLEGWEELVRVTGTKALKGLLDARTELENDIGTSEPARPVVGRAVKTMEANLGELDRITVRLTKQVDRASRIEEELLQVVHDAHRTHGWAWVAEQPMWTTWPLERFYRELVQVVPSYRAGLLQIQHILESVHSHNSNFAAATKAMADWHALARTEQWADLDQLLGLELPSNFA